MRLGCGEYNATRPLFVPSLCGQRLSRLRKPSSTLQTEEASLMKGPSAQPELFERYKYLIVAFGSEPTASSTLQLNSLDSEQ
jgi:hypothetical protein